jgi:hypothetical protein
VRSVVHPTGVETWLDLISVDLPSYCLLCVTDMNRKSLRLTSLRNKDGEIYFKRNVTLFLFLDTQIKIRSTPSLRRDVNLSATCKTLWRLKITSKYEQRYFEGQIHNFLHKILPAFLTVASSGRISREMWWTNQFSLLDVIPPWYSTPMHHPGDEQWLQLRDVVSPQRYLHYHTLHMQAYGGVKVKYCSV